MDGHVGELDVAQKYQRRYTIG